MKELKLIDEFLQLSAPQIKDRKDIVCGIGDDTAVLESADEQKYTLWTKDSLVEDVHFSKGDISFYNIGRKAMAVNLSDIAAMGGNPLYALVSISAPANIPESDILDIYKGISELGAKFATPIVGGDTTGSAEKIFISVSVLGEVDKKHLKLRQNAKIGEAVLVTGVLGGSILKKHYDFMPHVKTAQVLNRFPVSAMMDLSDGLGSDIFKLAKASRCGIMLDMSKLPVAPWVAEKYSDAMECAESALYDGEDFELLFTAKKEEVAKIIEAVKREVDVVVSVVGEILPPDKGYILKTKNGILPLKDKGFNHFG